MVNSKIKISQEELTEKTIRRIFNRGKRKGYVSPEYIEKTVKGKNIPSESLEELLETFKSEGIKLMDDEQAALEPVVKKKRGRKKGSTNKNSKKNKPLDSEDLSDEEILGKTDDPVRMYLREMGGVELLSREGEIAIAKRIEAGKNVMLEALSQSPITGNQFKEWNDKLNKNEILVREIIDIDTNYMEDEDSQSNSKKNETKEEELPENNSANSNDEEDFNPTLAAMEEEIKPKILKTVNNLSKEYTKLEKYQLEKLNCVLNLKDFSKSKQSNYIKICSNILENIKTLQLSPSVLEELVQRHYDQNRKIISLEGNLLRLAIDNNISREEFIKFYIGNEINPNLKKFLDTNPAWSKFFLDPSDSLVYFKMCRNLNRLKLLNKPSSKRKQIIQRKKHPAIVKFSTKRRSSSPSSVEMLNKSSDLQSMMQSPMKRRRRSFDQSELMISVERTPINGDKKSRNLTPMSVDTSVNKRNLLDSSSSSASKKIN